MRKPRTREQLIADNNELRRRLGEAEAVLAAIRQGQVDAVMVSTPAGAQVFTLQDAARAEELAERIAQREQAEEQIHLQLTALESSANAIVITDRAGTIVWVNPAFTQLTGYSREEAIGQNPRVLKSGQHGAALYKELWDCILAGKVWHGEMVNRRKDGALYYEEMVIAPVKQKKGEIAHFVAIKQDVSQRKRAEDQLARRTHELEKANQELEAFSYSVSHDLRTPLYSAAQFARLLNEEYGALLPPDGQRCLALVNDNVCSMIELVNGLLDFSRTSRAELQKQSVATAQIAQQALHELCQAKPERKIEIVMGNLPECQADPLLLKQVYINLLSNALKFTRSREIVRIEIGYGAVAGEQAYFVKDNGVGFDPECSDKLFGVFQRFHDEEEYEGTGVGLAIVRRIIQRHGGRIWAHAQVDHGATFYFTL